MKKLATIGLIVGLALTLTLATPLWIPFYVLFWLSGSYLLIKLIRWLF